MSAELNATIFQGAQEKKMTPCFQDVVQQVWTTPMQVSDPLQLLDKKFRATVRALTSWGQSKVGNVKSNCCWRMR